MNDTNTQPENCRACRGEGTQLSVLDGLVHRCPACGGSGEWATAPRWPWPQPWPQDTSGPSDFPWWPKVWCVSGEGWTQ